MTHRITALIASVLLLAGGALTWSGKPEREVSMTSVGELWADIFRDADSFGLQLTRVSAAEEMDLGRKISAGLVQSSPTAAAWETYVSAVGQGLAKHARRKDIRYEFHVIDLPVANAFSVPGGQIFIYTGLLNEMKTESELAGVLGHEIAHVDLRHCIERFQYQLRLKKLGLGDVGILVNIARSLMEVGYAQYQELDADAEGLRMAMANGYDPQGTIDLFRRIFMGTGQIRNPKSPLEEMAQITGSVFTDYFRSHPPTPERMRRLTAQIVAYRHSHAGQPVYMGAENLQKRIAKSQQEFPGESIRP